MNRRILSTGRTLAGLALAIVVAPVATALCIEIMLAVQASGTIGLSDQVGGGLSFLVLALVFGSVLAAIPGLLIGGLTIAAARLIGTRSPWYYAVAGFLAGTFMAWIDTGRTKSAFALPEAIPFVIGGGLSALTYWACRGTIGWSTARNTKKCPGLPSAVSPVSRCVTDDVMVARR